MTQATAAEGIARLAPAAAAAMRTAIRLAGGREVCFVCSIGEDGVLNSARVVARGHSSAVLALPGIARRGEMLVHNHPSGVLSPSDEDLEVAARLFSDGVGFAITDNDVSSLYVVVEMPESGVHSEIDESDVAAILGPDGPVSALLQRYEDRPSQRDMAAAIAQLYNTGGVGLLEAGTGVGKSLGYLVPALRWAAANGDRTVVSTNTINLQEQLVGKDLPFLREALTDQKVRFALLKGWRNYVCLVRLEQARENGATLFDEGTGRELASIRDWADKTQDGSLADLPVPPRPEVWDEVAAEPDLCLRLKCQHFDKCFLYKARREAANADVIVVNHHLLMSDLAVRRAQQNWDDAAVLPAYDRVIIDEGHHLEDAASTHLGISVTRRGLLRLFGRLERKGKGLLPSLAERLAASKDLLAVASLDLVHAKLAPATRDARERAGLVFDMLETFIEESGTPVVRLTEKFASHKIWRAGLTTALDDLLREVELMHDGLRLIRERLESDPKHAEEMSSLLNEMRGVARRLQSAADGLRLALRPPADAQAAVRWVEVRGRVGDRNVAVASVPLDLAPILREDLFGRMETAIVTSATLATDGRFDFLASRLGVDTLPDRPATSVFPSPFDYPSQAVLAVATDVPAPNVNAAAHLQAVVKAAMSFADAADGGIFVLFTSHRDVRECATEMRTRGADRRWPLLVHGDDARDALLRRFRESGRAILIGTASFWEGVDVPGDALRGMLIAKLPFRVPTEPVTAAQCEAIEARGGDSFREYMLPHAALRLKQGFGRLVRTSTDRGVVLVMDSRLATKSYGRSLLNSLPDARRIAGPWDKIEREIRRFYGCAPQLASTDEGE
jgi:ATP-dependent DNA helicase DinG